MAAAVAVVAPERLQPAQRQRLLLPASIRRLSRLALDNVVAAFLPAHLQPPVAVAEVLKLRVCLQSVRPDAATFSWRGIRLPKKKNGAVWPLDSIREAACLRQETWSFPASTTGFLCIAQTPANSFLTCRPGCRKRDRR